MPFLYFGWPWSSIIEGCLSTCIIGGVISFTQDPGRDVDWSICKGYPEVIIKAQSSNIIQNQTALTVLHWRISLNSVVRRRKDSSWESTPNICKSSGVGNIDHNPRSTTATGSLHGTVISPVLSPSSVKNLYNELYFYHSITNVIRHQLS